MNDGINYGTGMSASLHCHREPLAFEFRYLDRSGCHNLAITSNGQSVYLFLTVHQLQSLADYAHQYVEDWQRRQDEAESNADAPTR